MNQSLPSGQNDVDELQMKNAELESTGSTLTEKTSTLTGNGEANAI
jgi:hypothetical protein